MQSKHGGKHMMDVRHDTILQRFTMHSFTMSCVTKVLHSRYIDCAGPHP